MQDIMIIKGILVSLLVFYFFFSDNEKVSRILAFALILIWFPVIILLFFTGISGIPMNMINTVLARFGDIALLLLVLYLCYALTDKYLSSRINAPFSSGVEKFVFLEGLGLGVLACIVLGLGLCGLLYAPLFYILLLLAAASVADKMIAHLALLKNIRIDPGAILKNRFILAVSLIFLVFFITDIIGALAPPIAWDELWYHLPVVKAYVEHHRIFNMPYNMRSAYVMSQDMLFVIGMLLKGDILAKLFHFAMGILTSIAVYSFSRNYFSSKTSLLAALIFFTGPFISWESTAAYIDLGLAYFELLAVYAVVRWLITKKNIWLILGAVFCGLSMGAKPLALLCCLSLSPLILWGGFGEKGGMRAALKRLFQFGIIVMLVSLVWYLRNYFYTGNPFFPLLNNIFRSEFWYPAFSHFEPGIAIPSLGSISLLNMMLLPWDLTFLQYPVKEQEFGPIFIMFIPLLFLFRFYKKSRLNEAARFLIVYIGVFLAVFGIFAPLGRYLIPLLPLLSMITSYAVFTVISYMNKTVSRIMLALVLTVIILSHPVFAPYWLKRGALPPLQHRLKAAFGLVSRGDYLSSNLGPSYAHGYPGVEFINRALPASARVLTFNIHSYYIKREAADAVNYSPSLKGSLADLLLLEKEKRFMDGLKHSGITHIALNLMGPLNVTDKLDKLSDKGFLTRLYSKDGIRIYSVGPSDIKKEVEYYPADQSIVRFIEELRHDPNNIPANLKLAAAYSTRPDFWNRDYDEAVRRANKVLTFDPNNMPAYMCLGYIYWAKETAFNWGGDNDMKMSGYKSSVGYFKKALELEPDNVLAVSGIAYDYCSTGAFGPILSSEINKIRKIKGNKILLVPALCTAYTFLLLDRLSFILGVILFVALAILILFRAKLKDDRLLLSAVALWVILIFINYFPLFFVPLIKFFLPFL